MTGLDEEHARPRRTACAVDTRNEPGPVVLAGAAVFAAYPITCAMVATTMDVRPPHSRRGQR